MQSGTVVEALQTPADSSLVKMSRTSIELVPLKSSSDKIKLPKAAHIPTTKDGLDGTADDQNDLHRVNTAASSVVVTSKSKTAIIIASITMVTGVASMLNGIVTVILPTLQVDLQLSESILLW